MGSTGETQMIPTQVTNKETNLFAMQLANAPVLPMVAGPGAFVSSADLASQLPTKNPDAPVMLDRMLRLLASYSILTYSLRTLPDGYVERLYGLGPYHGTDPRFNKVFNRGMAAQSTITMKKLLETYKGFEGLTSVVDVGGGTGAVVNMIVSKYPSIKGINFDLPHVIEDAPQFLGVEHVGGDMFASVPKGDAIFMKSICHDWSDDHCLKFLKNCYTALPDNGKVILAECILPVAPDSSLATQVVVNLDVIMLGYNPGGKERTEKEFEALAKGSGFKGFRVICSAFHIYAIEFLKKI
ncbi:unnamed protein product [Malus baccata var. baccata]